MIEKTYILICLYLAICKIYKNAWDEDWYFQSSHAN